MRARLLLASAVLLAPLALWTALPLVSDAASSADRLARIEHKLHSAQERLDRGATRARVLTGDIAAFNRRIDRLARAVDAVSARVGRLDGNLSTERAALETVQRQLRAERARKARLGQRLELARRVLARQLVAIYKADEPDIVTVVLSADGFEELLERTSFLKRVNARLAQVLVAVRDARDQARAAAARLAVAQRRQAAITARIQRHRNAVAAARDELLDAQAGYAAQRQRKRDALRSVQDSQSEISDEVRALRAAQARIESALRSAQANNAPSFSSGGLPSGSGRLIWPVNGPITSPFCERRAWEACHPGIDIGVPEGTPIHAAAAGRVILMQSVAQSGGYGNYTCIQHTQTMSSCYAHQSRFGTTLGATVAQGQVIGYVGNTGHSFGAHLHWEVRINGAVVNPASYV